MASSKLVSTNPDLPRDPSSSSSSSSSISPLSSLLSDLHPMDDLLKSITPNSVDDFWKGIAAASTDNAGGVTLEDFLTKAIPVTEEDVRGAPPPPPSFLPFPAEGSSSSVEPFANNGVGSAPSNSVQKGKRRAVEEPVDKATLQKLRRMIKNRESAARSRERKQAYTSELEYLVHQLEQENARLLKEEVRF
ncbi:bZIP transcription factor bZIP9 isoform 2 [Glycine max]|uniref:BZIP transcription factor bZIP9 n=2 Tax=Glycine subgen. Soja TaxID=1462606 RepID=Q0GPE6_SOYBN|nr:bZIP transcription factor bZIP9 isoform 2 [Glycine max]ABI34678.1 bZIP transcription factor bZIP9 [Glycine max]RZC12138.1 bZIP transcription factor 12 isoform D [Glycine soja]|eukprot:NP_001237266.1 bZIP transcription factor bZIP9 isoform 2 [Glycine max]